MDEEKTEQATPHSRRKALERGQIPRSTELVSVFVLLIGFLTLYLIFNQWDRLSRGLFYDVFGNLGNVAFNEIGLKSLTEYSLRILFDFLWPIFMATAMVAILMNLLQTKGNVSLEPIRPKLSKINPVRGLQRMFSTKGLVELVKAILKIGMVTLVTTLYVRANLPVIIESLTLEPTGYFRIFGLHALKLGLWILALFIIIALLDLLYQLRQHEKDLMLSRQEAKQDYKEMEGDPLVRSRIRTRQRQIAMSRMLREVPRADVVITNPTHYAVALRYEDDMPAPQVVAKGKGVIAERIIAIAKQFDVHIHQNPPLARSLYAMVEVGGMVPYEFYVALAEVLAFVYKTKKKYSNRRKKMATSA